VVLFTFGWSLESCACVWQEAGWSRRDIFPFNLLCKEGVIVAFSMTLVKIMLQ
jgi:hypothetical protein